MRRDRDRRRPGATPQPRPGPVPAHLPARAGPVRGEEGLRRRRLRRLHRARRRRAGAQLHLPGPPRARAARSRTIEGLADATGCTRCSELPCRAGVPVRLLHGRDDHDGGRAVDDAQRADRPSALQGQPLPLHRLPLDRATRWPASRTSASRRCRRRPRAARRPARRRRHRARPASRSTPPVPGAAAPEAGPLAAPARAHPRRSTRRRALARARRRRRPHRTPTRRRATTPPRGTRHPDDDPFDTLLLDRRRALRRPAGRRGGGRDGARRPSGPPPLVDVDYELLPAVFDPRRGDGARARRSLHGDKRPAAGIADPQRNVAAEVHGDIGDVDARLRRGRTSWSSETFDVQRVQHVHLETHAASAGSTSGRLVLRTSAARPRSSPATRWPRCSASTRERVRVHRRPRRRRLRRQAGDAHRGRRRAGRAAAAAGRCSWSSPARSSSPRRPPATRCG